MLTCTARSLLQHARQHGDAQLGEGVGRRLPAAAACLRSCSLQEQRAGLFLRELEHEVRREAADVAAHGQVQVAGGHLVELGQVTVEHDLLAADEVDAAFDDFHGDEGARLRLGWHCFSWYTRIAGSQLVGLSCR